MTENSIIIANTPPHENAPVLLYGNTTSPTRALLLFHGRGASAGNILGLTRSIDLSESVLVCAPQAQSGAWYPQRFIVPRADNQPHLDAALQLVENLFAYCRETYGLETSSIVLAGFSQGACLVAEYVASHPTKYAGVCIYSGGLIGTDDEIAKNSWSGSLKNTSIYIGCDKHDPHIPAERVDTTAAVLKKQGANVTNKLYTNLGHAIHPEGIAYLSDLV